MATQNVVGLIVNGHRVGGVVHEETITATIGTATASNHNALVGRSLPNQHPISAIEGLTEMLDGIDTALESKANTADLADVAFSGAAEDLTWPDPLILYCGTSTEVV